MTPIEINIAIAESLGWRLAPRCADLTPERKSQATHCWIRPSTDDWCETIIPNYHGSRDACVEFEDKITLNGELIVRYDQALRAIIGDYPWRALAPQRCEAYLRTINKWIP